jgi:Chain length determinant protein
MIKYNKIVPTPGRLTSVIFGQEFASFLLVAWTKKLIIAIMMLLAIMLTVVALHFSTYEYTATLKVTAVQKDRQLSSNLAGLASLAGVSLPGGSAGSQLTQYIELLKSRNVSATLASDPYIMKHVFSDQWDSKSKQWRPKSGLSVTLTHMMKAIIGMPIHQWSAPDAEMLNKYIVRKLKLAEDNKSNVLSIMMEDKSPSFAIYFVNKIHNATDYQLRRRALDRSQKYVLYLESKLPLVTNADHRKALVDSLGEQEKVLMLASADSPFAAEPLGDTTSSFKPTSPNPVILLPLFALLGLILGLCAAFMLEFRCISADVAKSQTTE